MANAFSNGLRIAARKINLTKPIIQPMPKQGIQPVVPPVSPMTTQQQMTTPQVPPTTTQPAVQPMVQTSQSSLIKDVLRRKRMLEI